jgi:hypothetical protein
MASTTSGESRERTFVRCQPKRDGRLNMFEQLLKLVEERKLTFEDFGAGLGEEEPGGAVDFGELVGFAGAGRPFEQEGVAANGGTVEAGSFNGPGADDFSSGLFDGTQRCEGTCYCKAGFFAKFAPRGFQRILGGSEFPFGDGPRAVVFFDPERSTGMDEEDLELAVGGAIKEKASTLFGHRIWCCVHRVKHSRSQQSTRAQMWRVSAEDCPLDAILLA